MAKFWTPYAAAASMLVTTAAWGAEINLTDPNVAADADGQSSYTVVDDGTGVSVTFEATGPSNATLSYNEGDGIGIDSNSCSYSGCTDQNWGNDGGDDWSDMTDEVDQNETLVVTFSEDVVIDSIGLTDLYQSERLPGHWFVVPAETGQWVVMDTNGEVVVDENGDALVVGTFEGEEGRRDSNGTLTVDIGTLAGGIALSSTNEQWGYEDGSPYKGFSVGSVSFSTVPVPELSGRGLGASAFLLFGAAMLMGDRRRRSPAIEHS